MNQWTSASHALEYLARADQIPHRTEGEAMVLAQVPKSVKRMLDLGTGNGRLLALLKIDRPEAGSIALDFSKTMLEAAKARFADDSMVDIIDHNLDAPLPDLGQFDAIVSSFAIHHLEHGRKRSLYAEIFECLQPGGIFCNLEHVSSPTQRLHEQFLLSIGYTPETEDPSNQLLDVETQCNGSEKLALAMWIAIGNGWRWPC